MNGIYILANDYVYDQLVALLNSIETNISTTIPICILPYDDRLDKVRSEIAKRPQVSLFENADSIQRWEKFATQAWKSHDRAQKTWRAQSFPEVYRLQMHRKLCCFDGEFEKFVYFDADTLALGSIAPIFQKLDDYDWVANDYQYSSDIKYIFDRPEAELLKVFQPETLKNIFCAGWFASKKGIFIDERLRSLLDSLQSGEADLMALGGPDQSLMNYMVLRGNISYYNFAATGTAPGSHWSSTFEEKEHTLYDKGQRLMYLHYMSIATSAFNRLCQGENVAIPYRDLFLHYRYLNQPELRPAIFAAPKQPHVVSQFVQRKIGNLKYRWRRLINIS
ncbi:MAG: sugar transferase [Leptolyngbya sp. Prado105]|jgi:hypothetical protein|nr:sugar transferase [Leptolyngbya sp. Prado105]